MRKIITDLTILSTSLPGGIYVRHSSNRPDIIKAMIIGPEGTPYENGLFEFDIFCANNYPNEPPQVKFKTTGNGTASFNPNLYSDGKVCLSLLGTWEGEPWNPAESTLLQVLVSIQAMILCEDPWYNEPGKSSVAVFLSHTVPNCK
ncbi:UBC-like protein [Karstenula rhodostoma CBS 690.94]|uniref:UBC-like protein n=1 Tax=Karstenula rhodostoma CBS 690.94 TaxID=1392251 RepID=A0A9P4PMD4_9PLEO|nr:UBC-like protein [Karstenula rhodostoma CBS 690.94]